MKVLGIADHLLDVGQVERDALIAEQRAKSAQSPSRLLRSHSPVGAAGEGEGVAAVRRR
jgi:hypothetical protein